MAKCKCEATKPPRAITVERVENGYILCAGDQRIDVGYIRGEQRVVAGEDAFALGNEIMAMMRAGD